MGQRKIGASIVLDGEKQFKQSVTSCNKALSAMKSEMRLVTEQTSGQANTLSALQQKHTVLQKTLDATRAKEAAIADGLAHAQGDYEKIGEELDSYRKKLAAAQEVLAQMEKTGADSSAITQQQQDIAKLTDIIDRGNDTYTRAASRVQDWQTKLNSAATETIKANRALEENAAYLHEAENSTDGCAQSIDEYGKKISANAQASRQFGADVVEGFGAANNAINQTNGLLAAQLVVDYANKASAVVSGLAKSAYAAAGEIKTGYVEIVTGTGATGERLAALKNEMENIYRSMPVDAETAGAAIADVSTRLDLQGDALESTAEKFIKYAKINGTDVITAIATVSRAMGDSNVAASETGAVLDQLTAASQASGVAVDKLAESLTKYGAPMRNLGFEMSESMALFSAWEKAGVNTEIAFSGLKKAISNWASSGKDARVEFKATLDQIAAAPSIADATTQAIEVFGAKAGPDLADAIRGGRFEYETYIDIIGKSAGTLESTYQGITGTMSNLTVLRNNLKTAGAELAGEGIETLKPGVIFLTEATKDLTDEFKNMPPAAKKIVSTVGLVGIGFGTVAPKIMAVTQAISAIKGASAAASVMKSLSVATSQDAAAASADAAARSAQAVATEGATIAQTGLNAAMKANIFLAIAGAILAAASALAVYKMNTNEVVNEMTELRKESEAASAAMQQSSDDYDEFARSLEAEVTASDMLMDRLKTLNNQTHLTSAEQAELKTTVDKLNETYPDLGLQIDSVTGHLAGNTDVIYDNIAALRAQQRSLINQKMAEKLIDRIADAKVAEAEAQERVNEAQKKFDETPHDWQWQSEMTMGVEAESALGALQAAQKSYDEAKTYVADLTAELDGLWETMGESKSATETTTQAIEEVSNSAFARINIVSMATDAVASFEQLTREGQEYAMAFASRVADMDTSLRGTIDDAMQMFDAFNGGAKMSMDQILENLDSQINGVVSWEANIKELMERGINGDLLQALIDAGPGMANAVQTLVDAGADELAELNDRWSVKEQVKNIGNEAGTALEESITGSIAESMPWLTTIMTFTGTDTAQALIDGIEAYRTQAGMESYELGEEVKNSIIDAISDDEIYAAAHHKGELVTAGFNDAINAGIPTVSYVMHNFAGAGISAVSHAFDMHSPSRVMAAMADNVIAGFVNSIDAGSASVQQAMAGTFNSDAVDPVSPSVSGAGLSGAGASYGDININVYGSDGMDERALADYVTEMLIDELDAREAAVR